MPLYLPEIGVLALKAVPALGEPPLVPWYQSEGFIIVPILIMFGAGLLLGRILWKSSDKKLAFEGGDNFNEPESPDVPEDQANLLREEITADFERGHAKLQGEIDAAQSLISRQKSEIEHRDEKLALTQTQFEENERRVDELVSLTKVEPATTGNTSAIAHARATVIQLSETVKNERQHIGSGISRLEEIEDRVKDQNTQVRLGIDEVNKLRHDVIKNGGRREQKLAAQLQKLEDQLRVHHQNSTGCVQQATDARKRLQTRQNQLRNTVEPVSCVEKRVNDLNEPGEKKRPDELNAAIEELTISQKLTASYENGIQQEIAELDGRVDWLLNDSSQGFFTALDDLKTVKPPRNLDLRHELNSTERKLSEIRTLLTRMADPDATAPIPALPPLHRKINPAFTDAISALKTAAITEPVIETENVDISQLEAETETLREALAHEKEAAETLRSSLEENQHLLAELESKSKTIAVAEPTAPSAASGQNFMRRLIRLRPGRNETTQPEVNSLAEELQFEKGMTGPQMSIEELKSIAKVVETGPIGRNENELEKLRESLTERDETISKLEGEIRQLTAPIPLPSEIAALEKSTASTALSPVPSVTILPLEPGRFDNSPKETPADTGNDKNDGKSISIPPLAIATAAITANNKAIDETPPPSSTTPTTTAAFTVIFRGDDPTIWNSKSHDSQGNFAIPLSQIPESVENLRLKRLDTGESIEIPITRDELIAGNSEQGTQGWSGKAEHYFGSMHLGIFDETLPHEVETKFGVGGWGFGHRYEIGSGQAFAWAGIEIPPVRFEITVGHSADKNGTTTIQQGMIDDSTLLDRETAPTPLPEEGLIIFRSNNPALWNRTIYRGANQRARAIDDLPGDNQIKWLKLTRCDSGESILLPVEKNQLAKNGDGSSCGFNGTNELFYGAHHLGIFDSNAKLEIETRFTFGGWGFGHRNSALGEESQACGWGGDEIDADTVFEMTVFGQMPDVGPKDTVLGEKPN